MKITWEACKECKFGRDRFFTHYPYCAKLKNEAEKMITELKTELRRMTRQKDFYVREFKRMQKKWMNAEAKIERIKIRLGKKK